jgi:hypothetical protein
VPNSLRYPMFLILIDITGEDLQVNTAE